MSAELEHHKRLDYPKSRLKYRQGRKLKATKVYTSVCESQHLLVFGVPKINLYQEVKRKIQRYGPIQFVKCVTEQLVKKMELEPFTNVYHVSYCKLDNAKRAKRLLDAHEFYGGILHISYAPEYESIEELRHKLQQRLRICINSKQMKCGGK